MLTGQAWVVCPFLEPGNGCQPYQKHKDLGGEKWYPNESQGARTEEGMDAGRTNTQVSIRNSFLGRM